MQLHYVLFFFFFNDTATTEIYTLSLHDALPISNPHACALLMRNLGQRYVQYFNRRYERSGTLWEGRFRSRSEEHTSELQSRLHLVCRLLLEKKKKKQYIQH